MDQKLNEESKTFKNRGRTIKRDRRARFESRSPSESRRKRSTTRPVMHLPQVRPKSTTFSETSIMNVPRDYKEKNTSTNRGRTITRGRRGRFRSRSESESKRSETRTRMPLTNATNYEEINSISSAFTSPRRTAIHDSSDRYPNTSLVERRGRERERAIHRQFKKTRSESVQTNSDGANDEANHYIPTYRVRTVLRDRLGRFMSRSPSKRAPYKRRDQYVSRSRSRSRQRTVRTARMGQRGRQTSRSRSGSRGRSNSRARAQVSGRKTGRRTQVQRRYASLGRPNSGTRYRSRSPPMRCS